MSSSVIRSALAAHTAAIFSLVATAAISEAYWRAKVNATCPVLNHCVCENGTYAVFTRCRHIADVRQVDEDMAKLLGIRHNKLLFVWVNVTDLPAKWFSNQSVTILNIYDCPLRDVSAAAMERIQRLRKIRIEKGQLESVPPGLAAAKHLWFLKVSQNPIKALRCSLSIPSLLELDLSHNAIETVDEGYLSGFRELRRLVLSHNHIHHLAPNTFEKTEKVNTIKMRNNSLDSIGEQFHELHYLQHLDLSGNNITSIKSLVKSKMTSLKTLCLEGNRIMAINRFSHWNANIKELRLRNNVINEVEPEAFHSLKKLLRLDLRHNKISRLNETVFRVDSNLERLDLSYNMLTSISGTLRRTRRITNLKLSFNLIRYLTGAFSGLTDLKVLLMSTNILDCIEDGTFTDNLGLVHINMISNKIQWIGRNAFNGLLSLRTLRLEYNQLHSLNGSIRNLPKLENLGAFSNSIRGLEIDEFENDSGLKYVYLSENNISNISRAFTGVAALVMLDLQHNRVDFMHRSDFPSRMKRKPTLMIDDNPLMCDCRLSWLMQRKSVVQILGNPTCSGPSWHKGKSIFSLVDHDFVRWNENCSAGCHCECHEGPLGSRDIHVNCSTRALTSVPDVLPEGTSLLDLRDNDIEMLDDTVRAAAPELKMLSLKNNALRKLSVESLPLRLQHLDLRGNNLKRLPHSLLTERNLTALWLSGNRFVCDCADYPMRRWIQVHGDVIKDIHDIVCAESRNPFVARKIFASLREGDLCPEMISRATTYLLAALGFVAFTLVLLSTYLCWKHNIKTWLHARGCGCLMRCTTEHEMDLDKLFDVFVSFSSKDRDFVHENILPVLEANRISYCTYERNFKGGFLLQDIIRDAVACSRRTLLVLTQNFVMSEWCRWEFRVAHQRALQDKVNRLITVLVGEFTPGALNDDLIQYVCETNCLRWNETNFWEKLLRSMPRKDATRKTITELRPV